MRFLFWDIKWIEDEDIPNKLITLREADLQKIMYGEFAKGMIEAKKQISGEKK